MLPDFCRAKLRLSSAVCVICGYAAFAGGLSPEEALKHMKVADGFEAKLVASEPQIRQPLSGLTWTIPKGALAPGKEL